MPDRDQRGQALVPALAVGAVVLLLAAAVGVLGAAHAAASRAQRVADLAAVSGARALVAEHRRGAGVDRRRIERRVERDARAALTAGAQLERFELPGDAGTLSVEVQIRVPGPLGFGARARARAGLPGGTVEPAGAWATGGGYQGPLVYRDGKPTCPAVAAAFDRMDAAARLDGVDLRVVSGFRSDAEQAVLFARHPDPRWVAPPGRSRHRDATELDISTAGGAGAWLARHAPAFGFVQRYSWEPWHWGYTAGCGSGTAPIPAAFAPGGVPAWVPERYRAVITAAAVTHGIPVTVLAALLRTESGFDPSAVSTAGARGIAQFMPATARGMGLSDPFDPDEAIPAAARLLEGHLRAFGSIELALAAYNAGPGAVSRYGGIPPYAEMQAYIWRILDLAGDDALQRPGVGGVRLLPLHDDPSPA